MNDNLSIADFGLQFPKDVPNYKPGLMISKQDAPRLIRKKIEAKDLPKYEKKLVAIHNNGAFGNMVWKVVMILEYNDEHSEAATKIYIRDEAIEYPEHLKNFNVEYGAEVSSYIRNTCMPAPLREVFHIVRKEANVVYQANAGDFLCRCDMSDYDKFDHAFYELLGVDYED